VGLNQLQRLEDLLGLVATQDAYSPTVAQTRVFRDLMGQLVDQAPVPHWHPEAYLLATKSSLGYLQGLGNKASKARQAEVARSELEQSALEHEGGDRTRAEERLQNDREFQRVVDDQ
jgi:hypothetical protein